MTDFEGGAVPMLSVYSGQIIGAVVDALNIRHDILDGRTAKRFFAGEPVNEHNHTEILLAIGEVLVERGIVPTPPVFRRDGISMPVFLAATIGRVANRWDKLVSTMRSSSGKTSNQENAVERFLRLVIVDLALRTFAVMRLAEIEPNKPEIPLWAEENGGGKLLRELTRDAHLTRDQLAARAKVTRRAVDNWLDGNNRPTSENLSAISEALADMISGSTSEQLEHSIRRHLAFSHIADMAASLIGREKVSELSEALTRFIWLIAEDVNDMDRPPVEELFGSELHILRFGTTDPANNALLRNLALVEKDAGWKRDIIAATVDWNVSFQWVSAQAMSSATAAGLAEDIPVDSSDADDAEVFARVKASALDIDFPSVLLGGPAALMTSLTRMIDDGMEVRRGLVREFPNSARAHAELGSFLGMVGKNLGRRELVDEGVIECHIASALMPGWDNPAVEPGIMLINIGEYEEALRELNQAANRLPEPTPHLRFSTGYALMRLGRFKEALEHLELVIDARKDYALAHLYAADCAFLLMDRRKGIRFAKTARRLGEPGAFISWKEGKYPEPKRKRRARRKR